MLFPYGCMVVGRGPESYFPGVHAWKPKAVALLVIAHALEDFWKGFAWILKKERGEINGRKQGVRQLKGGAKRSVVGSVFCS